MIARVLAGLLPSGPIDPAAPPIGGNVGVGMFLADNGTTLAIVTNAGNAAAVSAAGRVNLTLSHGVGAASAAGIPALVSTAAQTSTADALANGPGATISSAGAATIACSVGDSSASGVVAQLPRTLITSVGAASANGMPSSIIVNGSTVIPCTVAAAAAFGVTTQVSITQKTALGISTATGVLAGIGSALAAQVGIATALGVVARIHRVYVMNAGNALAAGVSASTFSGAAVIPGATYPGRLLEATSRSDRLGGSRTSRIARTSR